MLLAHLILFSLTFTRLTNPASASMVDMISNILKHLVQKLESAGNLNNNNTMEAMQNAILHEVDSAIEHRNQSDTSISTTAPQPGSSNLTPETNTTATTVDPLFLTSTLKGDNNSVTALLDLGSNSSSSEFEYVWRTSAVYLDYYNDVRALQCVLPAYARTELENGNGGDGSGGKRVYVYEQIFSSQALARLQACKRNDAANVELAFCMGNEWNRLRSLSENWLSGRSQVYCPMIQCFDDVIKKSAEVPDWRLFLVIRMTLSTLCALRPPLTVSDALKDCLSDVITEAHIMMADILNQQKSPREYNAPSICYGDGVCKNIEINYYNVIQRYRCQIETTSAVISATQTAVNSTTEHAHYTSDHWMRSTNAPSDEKPTGTEATEFPLDVSDLDASSAAKSNGQQHGLTMSTIETTNTHGRNFHVDRTSPVVTMVVPTCTLALLGIMIFTSIMCVRMRRRKYRREAIGYEEVKPEDLP